MPVEDSPMLTKHSDRDLIHSPPFQDLASWPARWRMKLSERIAGVALLVLVTGSACSRPNAAFCCLTEEDCAATGVGEIRECAPGLSCVDNQCQVSTCSTEGCAAAAPVCDTTTDVCTGCSDSGDCTRFGEIIVCDPATGACVQCVVDADCDPATPVCDANSCRGCQLDSECPSGACSDNGSCIAELDTIYVSPTGANIAPCDRTAPCRSIAFAAAQASAARNHLVMAPGTYLERPTLDTINVPAPSITIHGSGATLTDTLSETMLSVNLPTHIRDLTLVSNFGTALSMQRGTLRRVQIRGFFGINAMGPVDARQVTIESTANVGINLSAGASLTLDGGIISGGTSAIRSDQNVTVDVTNTMIFDCSNVAIDLSSTTAGTIQFVTVANTGSSSTTASALLCNSANVAVASSIFWTPNTIRAPIMGGCVLSNTIAGPTGVSGAMNVDPRFANPSSDFHLAPNSPAKDMANSGPSSDFEGDQRPSGSSFDLGADEVAP